MKNLLIYYLLILLPLALIFQLVKNAYWFSGLLAAYVLLYRPVTDFYRLRSKGLMRNQGFLKVYHPMFHINNFRALYGL